ncbi:phosphoglycerate kinase, chloroplastic [Tanacetum coccineum]|uniref:phosphoglycerate kinase n=1 Tax=Tanacetum coccineum TaxID=301880 RepID=A0ABQ5AD53_9ASTR
MAHFDIARLDQVVITLASGDRGQGFDPHSLQGRRWVDMMGLDSFKKFNDALQTTKSVIQNGRIYMGVFEFDKFAVGTEALCRIRM